MLVTSFTISQSNRDIIIINNRIYKDFEESQKLKKLDIIILA